MPVCRSSARECDLLRRFDRDAANGDPLSIAQFVERFRAAEAAAREHAPGTFAGHIAVELEHQLVAFVAVGVERPHVSFLRARERAAGIAAQGLRFNDRRAQRRRATQRVGGGALRERVDAVRRRHARERHGAHGLRSTAERREQRGCGEQGQPVASVAMHGCRSLADALAAARLTSIAACRNAAQLQRRATGREDEAQKAREQNGEVVGGRMSGDVRDRLHAGR